MVSFAQINNDGKIATHKLTSESLVNNNNAFPFVISALERCTLVRLFNQQNMRVLCTINSLIFKTKSDYHLNNRIVFQAIGPPQRTTLIP